MKIKDIVSQKDKDLISAADDLRLKLVKLKFQIATKEISDFSEIAKTRREIAQIKTILREREIARKEEKNEEKA